MIDTQNISQWQAWVLASRPKTLPAAVAPVVAGSALAFADGAFKLLPALAALIGSLLLQIGVNLANDYFDYVKGVDTPDRIGPLRVTSSGLIQPERVRLGMIVVLGIEVLIGIYLVLVGGWPILAIGIASILSLLAYSGGPFPLASNGLGDLFVFLFFGLAAVCGTYYVLAQQITIAALIVAVIEGFLITAILVVNNLRDIETDSKTGKRTLAVILGRKGAQLEYALLLIVSYLLLPVLWLSGLTAVWVLLPILTLPMGWALSRDIRSETAGPALNRALAGTARLTLLFSILLSVGILLPF